jgi:circadian clock protein KaiC
MKMARVPTGVPGFDEIAHGGLISGRSYLVVGSPGAGKSAFSLQFLIEGQRRAERCLFISLAESLKEIERNALAFGWNLSAVDKVDLTPSTDPDLMRGEEYQVFSPSEVERGSAWRQIYSALEAKRPERVVIDSLTQLRYLSTDEYQFRKHMHALVAHLGETCTSLLTFEPSEMERESAVALAVDGIIRLRRDISEKIGIGIRSIQIEKLRGSDFMSGTHALRLTGAGIRVFPHRIEAAGSPNPGERLVGTGIAPLDELLGGGIESGTTTLISGPTGVGKSVLGVQMLARKAQSGKRAVMFTFEEPENFVVKRCRSIGTPIDKLIKSGNLQIIRVNPMELLPDEFLEMVRGHVENEKCSMVMVDSLRGYSLSMAEFGTVMAHIHNLVMYLSRNGVTTLLISEVENIAGGPLMATDLGVSHYADNVILLRYAEHAGQVIKVVNCLKKRLGNFQPELREYRVTSEGISVGNKLSHLRGVLTGTPTDMS